MRISKVRISMRTSCLQHVYNVKMFFSNYSWIFNSTSRINNILFYSLFHCVRDYQKFFWIFTIFGSSTLRKNQRNIVTDQFFLFAISSNANFKMWREFVWNSSYLTIIIFKHKFLKYIIFSNNCIKHIKQFYFSNIILYCYYFTKNSFGFFNFWFISMLFIIASKKHQSLINH